MKPVVSLLSGIIFGLGLIVADMTNPAKVQNFLDITGAWDPSLIFVMGGAIVVTLPAFAWLKKKKHPVLAENFYWPTKTDLDPKLIGGAAIFGFGWGLGGFCPGPALTALPAGLTGGILFVVCMLIGISAANMLAQHRARAKTV